MTTTAWERLDKDMVRAVMHRIRNGPETFDMQTYGYVSGPALCRTACCIAGEAFLVDRLRSGKKPAEAVAELHDAGRVSPVIGVAGPAARLLGLVAADDVPLFHETEWPAAYQDWDSRRDSTVKRRALRLLRDMIDGTVRFNPAYDRSWWVPFTVNRKAL